MTEHNKIVTKIAEMIDGIDNQHAPRKKGCHIPDIIKGDIELEVETLNKIREFKIKSGNWDKDKKRLLVVVVPLEIRKLFDEVIFWQS